MNIIERARSALARRGGFGSDLLVQSSGTILSQIIPILIAPLLTRLFTPVDFGLYGTVVSISTLLAILITLRVDHGVMVAETDEQAKATAIFALILALAGSFAFAIGATAILAALGLLDRSHLIIWGLFTPLAAFSSAAVRTTTLYSNRLKDFKAVSRARIFQAISTALLSVTLGYFAPQSHGLILSLVLGNLFYGAQLTRAIWPPIAISRDTALDIMRANSKFIRFSLPGALVNTLSSRLPFLIFPALYGLEQTGLLTLAYRVIATPARFAGTAIGEVFYSHAARQYQQTGTCWPLVRKVALLLSALGLVGFGLLFILAEPLFTIAFGAEWVPAATFTQILTPMLLIGFVVSPVSTVLYVAAKQREDLFWQLAFLTGTGIACFIGVWSGGAATSLMAFSAIGSVLYLVYFALIRKYARGREARMSE